jgi:hypothetical protein
MRIACFLLTGVFGAGACALSVLLIGQEPLMSAFALEFVSAVVGAGLLFGGLAYLYVHCDQREHLKGISNAIVLSLVPIIVGTLCLGALTENLSQNNRRFVLSALACSLGWWGLMLIAGILESRGRRWGRTVQGVLLAAPIAFVSAGIIYWAASLPPSPGSFWSRWNGVRLVGIVILMPVCALGLSLSLLDRAFMFLLGAFAVTLMVGAALGEATLGSLGWPILGAFVGSAMFVVALICGLVICVRKSQRGREPKRARS